LPTVPPRKGPSPVDECWDRRELKKKNLNASKKKGEGSFSPQKKTKKKKPKKRNPPKTTQQKKTPTEKKQPNKKKKKKTNKDRFRRGNKTLENTTAGRKRDNPFLACADRRANGSCQKKKRTAFQGGS